MDANRPELDAISNRIIGCAFTVANALGSGFLEKVYENALAVELRMAGLAVEQQRGITVTYKGALVGDYFVDLLVEGAVLIELKTVRALDRASRAMHQLPPGDRKTPVPAAQFRDASPGVSTRCSGPVSHAPRLPTTPHYSRSSAAICVHLR